MKMTDGKFKTPIYLATPENYKALIEFHQYPDIARIAPHCQVRPSPNPFEVNDQGTFGWR
jgi:hypothetical protein